MSLIDTHCHLNDEQLYAKRAEIIARMTENSVKSCIICGFDIKSSQKAIDICNEFPQSCYCSIGIHPEEVDYADFNDSLKNLESLLSTPKVVAIGEIGLDYHWKSENKLQQQEFFRKQIELALKYNKPIIIHSRDAIQDTLNILKEYYGGRTNSGVMHCYAGPKELIPEFIKLGFYISYGGTLTFKNSIQPKECIKNTPLDKILFETDAPYLTPHPFRGQINEPKYVRLVAEQAAELLGLSLKEISEIESKNAKRLFTL